MFGVLCGWACARCVRIWLRSSFSADPHVLVCIACICCARVNVGINTPLKGVRIGMFPENICLEVDTILDIFVRCRWEKEVVTDAPMVARGMILGVVLAKIFGDGPPVDMEVENADAVLEPIEPHVRGLGPFFLMFVLAYPEAVELLVCMGVGSWGRIGMDY